MVIKKPRLILSEDLLFFFREHDDFVMKIVKSETDFKWRPFFREGVTLIKKAYSRVVKKTFYSGVRIRVTPKSPLLPSPAINLCHLNF